MRSLLLTAAGIVYMALTVCGLSPRFSVCPLAGWLILYAVLRMAGFPPAQGATGQELPQLCTEQATCMTVCVQIRGAMLMLASTQ